MPVPNDLPDDLKEILFGNPWGTVYPGRPNPPPLAFDGRTAALRILRRYLAALTFMRPMGRNLDGTPKAPEPFKLPEKNIHIGWPDYEVSAEFPTVTFLHGPASYNAIGFNSYLEESTRDRYGRGTVVQWMAEYQENVILEIWANKRAELRSLTSGIVTALSPTEVMYGLRFRMPEYFDELVCFTPGTKQEFDEEDSARNRRRARIEVEMRYTEVALVNYELVRPELKVTTDVDIDYNTPVDDEELGPSRPKKLGPCDPCG